MFLMHDEVYRLWKIAIRSLKNPERLSCSVYSKEANYQLAVKTRRRAHKKRRQDDCERASIKAQKRQKVMNSERSRYKRAEAKYFRARENLKNFVYNASDIEGDYRDNFCVEFNVKQNQIDIFFGSLNRRDPIGPQHGHCGLNPITLRPKFPTRYPGEPHPIRLKKNKFHRQTNNESASIVVCGTLAYAIND